jgi:hypothetical protein
VLQYLRKEELALVHRSTSQWVPSQGRRTALASSNRDQGQHAFHAHIQHVSALPSLNVGTLLIVPFIFTVWVGSGKFHVLWNPTDSLPMTVEQKQTWEAWIRAKTTPRRIVLGSRICLLAAEGKANHAIAHHLDTSRPTVLLWRKRFKEAGPSGLPEDAPHGPSAHRLALVPRPEWPWLLN